MGQYSGYFIQHDIRVGEDMIKYSSGEKTANSIIYTGDCVYCGVVAVTGGSNRTIKIYNGQDNSGSLVEQFVADGNKPTDGVLHSAPIHCPNGIYLEISGGSCIVYYSTKKSDFWGRGKTKW